MATQRPQGGYEAGHREATGRLHGVLKGGHKEATRVAICRQIEE